MDGWSTPSHLVIPISEINRQYWEASSKATVRSVEVADVTRRYCGFPVWTVVCQTEAQLVHCQ